MKKFSILKFALLTIGLSGCGRGIPDFPDNVFQCQYNGTPRAFYCVNVKTKDKMKIPGDSSAMRAAQCLSADDYKKSEAWVQTVVALAEKRCK